MRKFYPAPWKKEHRKSNMRIEAAVDSLRTAERHLGLSPGWISRHIFDRDTYNNMVVAGLIREANSNRLKR